MLLAYLEISLPCGRDEYPKLILELLILPLEIEPVVSFDVPVVSQPESASESKAAAAAVKMRRIM